MWSFNAASSSLIPPLHIHTASWRLSFHPNREKATQHRPHRGCHFWHCCDHHGLRILPAIWSKEGQEVVQWQSRVRLRSPATLGATSLPLLFERPMSSCVHVPQDSLSSLSLSISLSLSLLSLLQVSSWRDSHRAFYRAPCPRCWMGPQVRNGFCCFLASFFRTTRSQEFNLCPKLPRWAM